MGKKGGKKSKPEESIHTKIKYPNALRKTILASTIEVIEALKNYEILKEIRANKLILLDDLKKETKHINRLAKELGLDELPLKLQEIKKLSGSKEKKKEIKQVKPETKLDKKWQQVELELHKTLESNKRKHKLKPQDKLENDLQALRDKMAQL